MDTPMDRSPKSRTEIERLVLAELKAEQGCEGATGIVVAGWQFVSEGPNWTVSAFNSGSSCDYECERALMGIVTRLQGFYELVQKH